MEQLIFVWPDFTAYKLSVSSKPWQQNPTSLIFRFYHDCGEPCNWDGYFSYAGQCGQSFTGYFFFFCSMDRWWFSGIMRRIDLCRNREPLTGNRRLLQSFFYAYHPSIAFSINCVILVSNEWHRLLPWHWLVENTLPVFLFRCRKILNGWRLLQTSATFKPYILLLPLLPSLFLWC